MPRLSLHGSLLATSTVTGPRGIIDTGHMADPADAGADAWAVPARQYAYRKIMERYPGNGKVLKCYGKFLEEVKNDIAGATKYYNEGNRIGNTDAMMNM